MVALDGHFLRDRRPASRWPSRLARWRASEVRGPSLARWKWVVAAQFCALVMDFVTLTRLNPLGNNFIRNSKRLHPLDEG